MNKKCASIKRETNNKEMSNANIPNSMHASLVSAINKLCIFNWLYAKSKKQERRKSGRILKNKQKHKAEQKNMNERKVE